MMGLFFKQKAERLNDRQYIIAGLGNPGKEYEDTRHNVGFDTIEVLAAHLGIPLNKNKFEAVTGSGTVAEGKLLLMQPQTYMNLSGGSIARACNFYKIPLNTHLIIIYDDVDLPVGSLRIRKGGSAGGHNGMKSIISALSGDAFIRIRIGVGAKTQEDLAAHVLGRFSKEDREIINGCIDRAAKAALCIVQKGCDAAMNRYNTPNKKPKTGQQAAKMPETQGDGLQSRINYVTNLSQNHHADRKNQDGNQAGNKAEDKNWKSEGNRSEGARNESHT